MLTVSKIIKNKLWVASALSLVISLIVVPIVMVVMTNARFEAGAKLTIKDAHVKEGNRVFYNFLKDVKKTNGVMILGTSETGNSLDGNNYWSFLQKNRTAGKMYYDFGGAGRTCNMYFPLILKNADAFKGLEIIYYINPTYWRKGLNAFNEAYYNRYVGKDLNRSIQEKDRAVVKDYLGSVNGEVQPKIVQYVDDYRSLFYHDLKEWITSSSKKELNVVEDAFEFNDVYRQKMYDLVLEKVDTNYNVLHKFLETNTLFPMIDPSDYQYDQLQAFIDLNKTYGVKCVYYLGPFNEIYCNKMNPENYEEHAEVVKRIQAMLSDNAVNYIDGTYQGSIPGTFLDVQHISEYGAYLTALDIKKYYEAN